MKGGKCTSRLSVTALALAFGIVSGLGMMLFAWTAMYWGHGGPMIAQWAEIFPGYAPTLMGGLIGGGWGFLEGVVTGLIFGFVYNFSLCCCKYLCTGCSSESCDTKSKR